MDEASKEEWRAIRGFPGYEVSNLGRVRSYRRYSEGRILAHAANRKGYRYICLMSDGERWICLVHRLVALAFVSNDRPGIADTVDHIDFDKTNNAATNLRWLTNAENGANAHANPWACGVCRACPLACVDVDTGQQMAFPSIMEASRRLSINQGLISLCAQGKRTCVGRVHIRVAHEPAPSLEMMRKCATSSTHSARSTQ